MSEKMAADAKQKNEDRKRAALAKERNEGRKLFLLEVIVVLITIVAFLIPSILYALPPPDSSLSSSNSSKVSNYRIHVVCSYTSWSLLHHEPYIVIDLL
jgi:uncharacterized membrane protein